MKKQKDHVVLSLSGGLDSSTLLLKCIKEFNTVMALSFDYGQKHRVELERAQSLIKYLKASGYNVRYQVIKLDGLSQLLNSTLVEGGGEVPEGFYAEENQKQTVVPNRNKIFTSIIQAAALSIVKKTNQECDIALGIHAGDHTIYPDCRQEFRDADDNAFRLGNWDAEKVKYYTPYLEGNKFTILQDGERLCKELGLDFNEVYSRTNTSYKPVYIPFTFDTTTCGGTWCSDYKSASSVERIEAFIKLGRPDPVTYANETGIVTWEYVVQHVNQILEEHNK
jgi:7-cyano-7-deazaguanine synthase